MSQIPSPYRRSRSAFTLIELLVVIAIIAILAAILFPVFAQARAKARQASCISNMKQMGLGVMMYVQDYDNTIPAQNQYGQANDPYIVAARLQPYVKNFNIFRCPDSPLEMGTTQAQQQDNGSGNYMPDPATIGLPASTVGAAKYYSDVYPPTDYRFNASFYNENDSPRTLDSRDICQASQTALAVDWPPINSNWPGAAWWTARGVTAKGRHTDGSVVMFADGHAKWFPFSKLYPAGTTNGRSDEWNYWGFAWGSQATGGNQDNNGGFPNPSVCP